MLKPRYEPPQSHGISIFLVLTMENALACSTTVLQISHKFICSFYHSTSNKIILKDLKSQNYIFQIHVSIFRDFWVFDTSRGNINDLKYFENPTIISFHLLIHLFDVKFVSITPHSLVVFQLCNVTHIKNAFSIDNNSYT